MIVTLLIVIVSCGGEGDVGVQNGDGALAISISNAKGFDLDSPHGEIERYQVTVRGEGIPEPIIAEFPGDATHGVIENIPAGDGREVLVSAYNPNGLVIRAGEEGGVRIGGGANSVDVRLESVPIFVNIADGSTVVNTRLSFRIFARTENLVLVEDEFEMGALQLVDAATNLPQVNFDTATGLGKFAPANLLAGVHVFTVRDVVTGRNSKARVRLIDGGGSHPAPLVAAAKSGGRAVSVSSATGRVLTP